jgi:hypothetical protein
MAHVVLVLYNNHLMSYTSSTGECNCAADSNTFMLILRCVIAANAVLLPLLLFIRNLNYVLDVYTYEHPLSLAVLILAVFLMLFTAVIHIL